MRVRRIDAQAAVDIGAAVDRAGDLRHYLPVERRQRRGRAQAPRAGAHGREADLPAVLAVVEAGDTQQKAAGTGELAGQLDVERIPGRGSRKDEIVRMILLDVRG